MRLRTYILGGYVFVRKKKVARRRKKQISVSLKRFCKFANSVFLFFPVPAKGHRTPKTTCGAPLRGSLLVGREADSSRSPATTRFGCHELFWGPIGVRRFSRCGLRSAGPVFAPDGLSIWWSIPRDTQRSIACRLRAQLGSASHPVVPWSTQS